MERPLRGLGCRGPVRDIRCPVADARRDGPRFPSNSDGSPRPVFALWSRQVDVDGQGLYVSRPTFIPPRFGAVLNDLGGALAQGACCSAASQRAGVALLEGGG
jgi:hypothetical protein